MKLDTFRENIESQSSLFLRHLIVYVPLMQNVVMIVIWK